MRKLWTGRRGKQGGDSPRKQRVWNHFDLGTPTRNQKRTAWSLGANVPGADDIERERDPIVEGKTDRVESLEKKRKRMRGTGMMPREHSEQCGDLI